MKRFNQFRKYLAPAVLGKYLAPAVLVAAPAAALAQVPTYVTTALTNAQTTLTQYLEASAPFLFAVTILISAIFLIVRMIKRAAS